MGKRLLKNSHISLQSTHLPIMCHIVRCIALYNAETWILRKTDQTCLENFEMEKDGADKLDRLCER